MRIRTTAHPTEYCRSAPPLNAFPRIPVTLGLPCSPENEEVPHGEKDQGQGGPEAEVGERAFAERDRPHRPRLEAQRPGRAGSREGAGRLLGGRRGDVRGGRLRAAVPRQGRRRAGARRPRLGTRPPRAREDRRHAQAPARGVCRRVRGGRRAVDVLRQVLQALPPVHGVAQRGEPRRAQGGQEHGGRLVRAHDAARGPRDRRGQEGVPVRGLPPVQPVQLRRADARHEAGYMAAVPRARLLLPGRRDAPHRPRQPEDRRHRPPQGRGAGPERGLRGARRALRLRRDPGEGQEAPRQAERRERGLGRRDLRDSGASRRGVHRHGGPPRRRRPEGRGAQRRAVRQARGLEARGVRGGRAPAAEAPTGRALRGVRVGLRPQGPGQLPRRVRPQLLLGEPPARRLDGRPARHRGQGGGLLRRRARGHAPQVPVLREEPLLHARLGHARGQGVVGLGRAAHPRLGLEGRALLLRAGGQGVRLLRVRRAGLQRRARRAQAVQALHPGEARAGVRDGARDREEVAALPRRRARAEVGAGQGAVSATVKTTNFAIAL